MNFSHDATCTWMKVFRINPEFRILWLTFHIWKVSPKMLKYTDFDSLADIFSGYLKTLLTIKHEIVNNL